MKILIIMGGYFPGSKYGGPPVSIDNFCSLLKEYNCYIITHNHDMGEEVVYSGISTGWNDRGNCKVLYLSNENYNKKTFEKVIIEIEPNILYLQGVFQSCILPSLQLAKKHKIPVLLAPRGELCAGAFNIHKWKKRPYIELIKMLGLVNNIHWQSTSDEETKAIKKIMGVDNDRIHRLDNIPTMPKHKYLGKEKKSGEGRFVFLSRIHPKKNLLFAISLFEDMIGKVQYDIYGPIEDKEYWKQCQQEINRLSANVKIKYKGQVAHEDVHKIFSQYDAFLLPTLSENYGHVIVESLSVGTPVIISDQTPWRDLESVGVGWDISLSNSEKFKKTIQTLIMMDKIHYRKLEESVISYINRIHNFDDLKDQYTSVIIKIMR